MTNVLLALAISKPYIRVPDDSQVEWSTFRLVNFIIHDGWRVGLTGSYLVNALSMDETRKNDFLVSSHSISSLSPICDMN